ncbi:hypothetical protein GCM10023149_40660 [Mucilaginibacter gynuensis]|uniref:histidine kinase n=2 Tax=Mucilaginibacter gynuensis TaxID=1302236 RepID=A0ABP8H3P6_9SPHI
MVTLFSVTCTHKPADNGDYSDEFKVIFKNTEQLIFHNKINESMRYLDSAVATIPHPTINDRFRTYGLHYVATKRAKGDNVNGLLYADSMVQYAKKSVTTKQYSENFAEANFSKGDVLFDIKRYNDAYECFYQGYLVGKNYLNNDALSDYTYRMGMIMYKQGHYKLAVNYFKDSYKQSSSKQNFVAFYRRQEILDNIGLGYKKLNNPDSAMFYFTSAIEYIKAYGHNYPEKANFMDIGLGVVYGNMAEVLVKQGKHQQAIDLLKKSISINLRKGNDNIDAQLTEVKLGQLYLDNNQIDSLKSLLAVMRRQLDTLKNENAEADWNRLLANYYLKNKDFEKAVRYLQGYNIQKDSIDKKLLSLKESDVNQQLANYEQQHEINTLSNNNKLQKTYLYVAIICAVMLSVIISLIYRNWKRSRKAFFTVNNLNKQINEQNNVLEDTLTELNGHNREKDRIMRAVAHDLRNPLGGIASLTSSMMDDEYTDEQKELINLIKETSYNSLELINEILEATNNSNGKLNKEFVEINALLSNSVELLRFKAAEKNQKIVLELLDTPEELFISREKIWRVISNLISNATKFSPFGSVIYVTVIDNDNDVCVAVKDKGIGIPDNLKTQVFHMFTDAKRPGTAGEKSFGLGLSICKQIIEKHDGKIWFESTPGAGTTFYIQLQKQSTVV